MFALRPVPPHHRGVQRVGRYRLLGRLGAGGMGDVHRARAYGAEGVVKDLCIKRIRSERLTRRSAIARFVEEARVWAGLHHANIVSVFDFGRSEDGYYLAMEWVDGVSARSLVSDAPLPADVAAHVGAEIARALEYAHGLAPPLVHRDVKPANVLVSRAGDVKLTDFGVAALAGSSTGAAGTPGYIAPEQLDGGADTRSDLWALGVVLTELVSGDRDPSRIENAELRAIAEALTASDPGARPGSASDVANLLESYTARARAAGSKSPREQLAERARACTLDTQPIDGELHATASYAHDGDGLLDRLSAQTTAGPSTGSSTGEERPRLRWLAASGMLAIALTGLGAFAWSADDRADRATLASSTRRPAARARAPAVGTPPARVLPREPAAAVAIEAAEPEPYALSARTTHHRGTAPHRAPASPPAWISMNAIPWARVYVDGRDVGVTPLFDVALTPGRHTLRFVNEPLGAEQEREIVGRSGQSERVIVRFGAE